jgi:hypothetical protein
MPPKGDKPKKHRPVDVNNTKIINPFRSVDSGKTHLRSKDTIKRLAMYNSRAVHDRKGRFVSGPFMSRTPDEPVKRIAPNRSLFGMLSVFRACVANLNLVVLFLFLENSRVVGQKELADFRESMGNALKDPYTVYICGFLFPVR